MNILVTGGAGFIGSNLVERLVQLGHNVTIIDSLLRGSKIPNGIIDKVNLVVGDVRDAALVHSITKGIDVIFHFAAVLGVDIVADHPVETMEVEVLGTKNITDAAISNGVRKILYASTSGIYGHSAIEKSVTEDIMVDPRTSYAMAKRYNEIYLASLYEEKGFESISLRFFNVYGYRQDNRMVIPRFLEQANSNEEITIFGSGDQTRDFTWIDDTVEACIKLIDVKGCHIVNIANDREYSIKELAQSIKLLTKSESVIKNIEPSKKRYDYEVERRVGNSDKLYSLVGYKPNTTLEEGLTKILASI